jgi:[acyl-carrier-protein] S-malonyltransferase
MKTALIFPGQGSQFIGMGHDFYSKYEVSREIFNRLDDAIEKNMSKLIFSGEASDLTNTQNAQPSIMATSTAIFEALIYEKLLDENSYCCVAGHSLGEYSALVANKSIEFEDSVKLLKLRSKAMQESMPIGTGGMVALIGSSENDVKKILSIVKNYGKVFVANDNSNDQIVLSGEIKAIEHILLNAKALSIRKAIKLPVSAPFHCELIFNAAEKMKKELENYTFKTFSVPLYSNVTSEICDEKEIKKLLVNQIISKVRWREIVENMLKNGVQNFIEIGPGNVLTNLVKRASKDLVAISISKIEDFDKLDNIKL